jgi:hypothetical protein
LKAGMENGEWDIPVSDHSRPGRLALNCYFLFPFSIPGFFY